MAQSRGTASSAQTGQFADDDLRNILAPYEGSMNLLAYYDRLRDTGYTNNAMLLTLTQEKLMDKKIGMMRFHCKGLLQRIADRIKQ
eukprot:527221_1